MLRCLREGGIIVLYIEIKWSWLDIDGGGVTDPSFSSNVFQQQFFSIFQRGYLIVGDNEDVVE